MALFKPWGGLTLPETMRRLFVTELREPGERAERGQGDAYPYRLHDLAAEPQREEILSQLCSLQGLERGRRDRLVAGTLLAKRYSVYAMAVAAAISLYDRLLAVDGAVVRFEPRSEGTLRYETVMLDGTLAVDPMHLDKRYRQVREHRTRLQEQTQHLFDSLSETTGASVKVMWSLVAHQVQQGYALMLERYAPHATESRLALIRQDREAWLASGDNRFSYRCQPFEHAAYQGEPLYVRPYCCLAHRMTSSDHAHGFCNSCPKLGTEERLQQLAGH
ncbi:hypothetical protein PA598K_05622 [Paenibacillus sp. 598K]|uniref:hypothetical protein n=1 Tax=Paenibacillus sp. 598K TaxID=1117987 RepID=UPI000FFA3F17|nr:hypothetical protein [Paenibacillus sp. 598K]GBF77098.1 hypothetical protein PA598K_05622 [Paenibacillus sp. 598K]